MSNDITIKKSTFNKMIIGITAALVLAAFLGGMLVEDMIQQKTQRYPNVITSAPIQAPTQAQARVAVPVGDSPILGMSDAPVTMIEFSDFQCPFCGQYFSKTLPSIEKNYIDSGKVKLVFKNMPLENLHPNAKHAALAAECANEQNKFWEYHDKLFTNQNSWAGLSSVNATNIFKQYASQLGLDINTFNSCLDSEKYAEKINKDSQDGNTFGATGTPTFFIGSEKKGYQILVGALPFATFKKQLDSELAQ